MRCLSLSCPLRREGRKSLRSSLITARYIYVCQAHPRLYLSRDLYVTVIRDTRYVVYSAAVALVTQTIFFSQGATYCAARNTLNLGKP
jgi:hypothetical protein